MTGSTQTDFASDAHVNETGEEDDGGRERVVHDELAEPERWGRETARRISTPFRRRRVGEYDRRLTSKGPHADSFDKVDREGEQDRDHAREPAGLAVAGVELVHEQLDTLLDVDDSHVCVCAQISSSQEDGSPQRGITRTYTGQRSRWSCR